MKIAKFQKLALVSASFLVTAIASSQNLSSATEGGQLSIRRTIKAPATEEVIVEEAIIEEVEETIVEQVIIEETIVEEVIIEEVIVEEKIVEEKIVEEVIVEEEMPYEEKKASVKNKLPALSIEKQDAVNTSIAPSWSFDLSDWSLSVPSDEDGNGRADQIKEKELNSGYANKYFYTDPDGGMVFNCPIGGFKTSQNTSYTRSELREMLRAGDKTISTKGPNMNNWVLETSNCIYDAGGYDGQLNATLKVDHVTTTGKENQVGRVVIGQIHAEHNEPLRLYYRKLPNNTKGSIYFAHEGRDNNQEDYYELIGSKSSKAKDPEKGIALGEKFSYQILVLGNSLGVKIIKEDKTIYEKRIDISKSGYSAKEEYMYFKAGVYNQNKTGEPDDYVQATFYELNNRHKKYVEPTYDD